MKKFLQLLKNPPILFVLIFWFVSLGLIATDIALVALGYANYALYTLSALCVFALGYSVFLAIKFAPTLKDRVKTIAKKRPFTDQIINNYAFRTVAFSSVSMAITIAFALFNANLSFMTSSEWYAAIAGYYTAISIVRAAVFISAHRAHKKNKGTLLYREKLLIFRNCGITLLVLEVALTAAVVQLVRNPQESTPYSTISAIAFAAFATYKVSLAIYNTIKASKLKDPIVQSHRNIGLTDAAVSLLSMQVTMVAVFDGGNSLDLLNNFVGFAVCALTIVLGVVMIVKGTKGLNRLKLSENEGKVGFDLAASGDDGFEDEAEMGERVDEDDGNGLII